MPPATSINVGAPDDPRRPERWGHGWAVLGRLSGRQGGRAAGRPGVRGREGGRGTPIKDINTDHVASRHIKVVSLEVFLV